MTRFKDMAGCLDEREARMKNPLVLAYIGDTVYDLYMRAEAVREKGGSVNMLHRLVCGKVNAKAQSLAAKALEAVFTEEEADVFRRGRNAKSGTTPKNMAIGDYHRATGLEAVVGYLFLTGKLDRLDAIFHIILGES